MLRSGNSEVSWRSGVCTMGQVSVQRTPITRTMSPAISIMSEAPGTLSRRRIARATSISGEMITSIGSWSRANRFAHSSRR